MRAVMFVSVGVALATTVWAGIPLDKAASLQAIDRAFVCPERLPDDAMRETEMEIVFRDTLRVRPALTSKQQIAFVEHLYRSHGCADPNVPRG